MIGCGVAAVLLQVVHSDIGVVLLVLPFVFGGILLAHYNPVFYSVATSPLFLLLANLTSSGSWELAGLRILNTAIGSIIGLVCGYLLWRRPEQKVWRDQLGDFLEAARDCTAHLFTRLPGDATQARRVDVALWNLADATARLGRQPGVAGDYEHARVTYVAAERLHDALLVLETHGTAPTPAETELAGALGDALTGRESTPVGGDMRDLVYTVTTEPDVAGLDLRELGRSIFALADLRAETASIGA